MESFNRPFASGARKAPDPIDQYLEREGYYRKHVARDASSLFRTFSEQVFDVQMYHEKVRNDCISWMLKNSEEYKKKIHGDFDNYLSEMIKPYSYGTLIELNALAHAYCRNVILFEPYNLGTWYVKDDKYQEAVMVFFSHEKHFDSIFPTTFIQQAAYCQALVYEILYVKVFKLPDVRYSVERMLHDTDGKLLNTNKSWDKSNRRSEDEIVTSESKHIAFNTAEETNCVLENYRLCHFHNKDSFHTIVDAYRKMKNEYDLNDSRNTKTSKVTHTTARNMINPLLSDCKISCVRQLLKEGITPFPYKVAKALDPNIYRNIEFDSWNELRRDLRYKNWHYHQNRLQVGAKCMVQLDDLDERIFAGYVQEMKPEYDTCVVYVEDIAEYRTIPYEWLQEISLDQTRSSYIPFNFERSSSIHHFTMTCSKPLTYPTRNDELCNDSVNDEIDVNELTNKLSPSKSQNTHKKIFHGKHRTNKARNVIETRSNGNKYKIHKSVSSVQSTSYLNVRQLEYIDRAGHDTTDITKYVNRDYVFLTHPHVQLIAPPSVPYYTQDAYYIIPSNWYGIIMHANLQPYGLCYPFETQYTPMMHVETEYSRTSSHLNHGDNNCDNFTNKSTP